MFSSETWKCSLASLHLSTNWWYIFSFSILMAGVSASLHCVMFSIRVDVCQLYQEVTLWMVWTVCLESFRVGFLHTFLNIFNHSREVFHSCITHHNKVQWSHSGQTQNEAFHKYSSFQCPLSHSTSTSISAKVFGRLSFSITYTTSKDSDMDVKQFQCSDC